MCRRRARLLALVLGAALLAACSDEPDLSPSSSDGVVEPVETEAPGTSEPASAEPTPAEPAFAADTTRAEQDPSGGPLGVTTIRVAQQEGYDRVVFELDGTTPGEPGWTVEYVEQATQDGSGNPVEVGGEHVLSVRVHGVGYPMDTGVEGIPDDPDVPERLPVVEDVAVASVFEGVFSAFVGTSERVPFRVFRLSDPARVVVDLQHG